MATEDVSKPRPEVKVTLIGRKADPNAITPNALSQEDDFIGYYDMPDKTDGNHIIRPPLDLYVLTQLTYRNNALGPCIAAMETNIDGTEFVIEPKVLAQDEQIDRISQQLEDVTKALAQLDSQSQENEAAEPPEVPDVTNPQDIAQHLSDQQAQQDSDARSEEIVSQQTALEQKRTDLERQMAALQQAQQEELAAQKVKAFFDEPWPGVSFTDMRKRLRRDLETTGNGYLEVLRNLEGNIVFMRNVDSATIRMIRLGQPVEVPVTVKRNGEDITLPVMVRERRFVQIIAGKFIYFREFGTSRQINKNTGAWETPDKPVDVGSRGTELLHFTLQKDIYTPYGLPRWVGQLPSVIGSRKAEEFNLTYFEKGGIPPGLIVVQGGALAPDARKALEQMMGGPAESKQAFAVLEAYGTSGSLDQASNVKVTVERFDTSKMSDALFQNYDEKCANRIRSAFRLPEMFLGNSQSMNFATAQASYAMAEAQVFGPERKAFDAIINNRIMKEVGGEEYTFRSLPMSVKNVDEMIRGILLAVQGQALSGEDLIDAVNEATGMNLKYTDQDLLGTAPNGPQPGTRVGSAQVPNGPKGGLGVSDKSIMPNILPTISARSGSSKAEDDDIADLAIKTTHALRGRNMDSLTKYLWQRASLPPEERHKFDATMGMYAFVDPSTDPEALGQIAGCTAALIAANA